MYHMMVFDIRKSARKARHWSRQVSTLFLILATLVWSLGVPFSIIFPLPTHATVSLPPAPPASDLTAST
ncbi:MAG TPA: hypothetical protein VJA22_00330, partial [Patescibacteria group bacterium]|nr:hypothetical protein [Patescibacteria group bacterium]